MYARPSPFLPFLVVVGTALAPGSCARAVAAEKRDFRRLQFNNPGLVVDLGVGLWAQPLPMDFDEDGDNDLVVATCDTPDNGIYFFENTGGQVKYPTFRPAVRIGRATANMTLSVVDGRCRVLTPGKWYPDIRNTGIEKPMSVRYKPTFYTGRSNQWKLVDYDGDGVTDLVLGASDWREYGWDNAFDKQGRWTRGPLHGYVYFVRNLGTNEHPRYGRAVRLTAGGRPLEVFGMPSPNFADWDGDGDLDLICGEFLDKFTYFRNVGTRTRPRYAPGRRLAYRGKPLAMDLQMIVPVAYDWDGDGDVDLVVGQEDGRVALVENTGVTVAGMPRFLPPRFFRQQAAAVKCGALCTPVSTDWDGDGDEDLVCGDTAGTVQLVENLDGGNPPRWAAPRFLTAGGRKIRIQAGPNGSIQGPAEAKWGYTVPSGGDWDGDGLQDLIVNSIWGKVVWYRNIGTRRAPTLAPAEPIRVDWRGAPPKPVWNWWDPSDNELVTQWRTTPLVIDLNGDGLNDLVMLDHEGFLSFFRRQRRADGLHLLPGKRIFLGDDGKPLRLSHGPAGRSGRRKFVLTDWDGDGALDLLLNSRNIDFYRNTSQTGGFVLHNVGPVSDRRLAGHTTCPTVVDWDRDHRPDLLVGAEDGHLYYLPNPHPFPAATARPPRGSRGHP